jgi:hypothetical protein
MNEYVYSLYKIIVVLYVILNVVKYYLRYNFERYKCVYPLSKYTGYFSPESEKIVKDGRTLDAHEESIIRYAECVGDTVSKKDKEHSLENLKGHEKNLKTVEKHHENVKSLFGSIKNLIENTMKRFAKIVVVFVYILQYTSEKIKMILFKVQGVIDVLLNTFKIYLRFIHYVIFKIIPIYIKWLSMTFSMSLSMVLWSLIAGAGTSTLGIGMLLNTIIGAVSSIGGAAAGAAGAAAGAAGGGAAAGSAAAGGAAAASALAGPIAIITAVAALVATIVFTIILFLLNKSKHFLQANTGFNGIGDIPLFPDEGISYDVAFDPITSQTNNKAQSKSAGSIMNIVNVVAAAISDQGMTTFECLTSDNELQLKDRKCPIDDIKIGDLQINDSEILGIFEFKEKYCNIYNYNGVEMTGGHYVLDNGTFKMCKDLVKPTMTDIRKLYCPITSDGRLYSKDMILADYNDSKEYYQWHHDYDKRLNNLYTMEEYKSHNYPPLFADSNILKQSNVGVLKHKYTNNIKMYNYKGMIVSGTVRVYSNGKLQRVWQTSAKPVKYNLDYLYNIVTKNHIIDFNNVTFEDFEENRNQIS